MLATNVILLDSDYNFISTISWKKAMKLVVKEKVEVLKYSEVVIRDSFLPKIVKLFKSFSYLAGKKVKWSKSGVLDRDNYVCAYCLKKLSKHSATVDHIIPVAKGGKNSWKNTICSCTSCNNLKGDKWLKDTGMSLHIQPYEPTIYQHFVNKMKNAGFDIKTLMKDLTF